MINNNRLEKILDHKEFPAVSIFIPTLITGDYEVNRIRWKNELQKVYQKLEDQGYDKKSFMKSANDLLEDSTFWANQSAGLAGYFSEDFSEIVHLLEKPETLNVVSNTFIASPILLSKINKQRVFLLTLSQNNIRFFEAVNSGIFPVKIDDLVPADMDEALYLDIQKETLHPSGQGLSNTNHFKDKTNVRLEQYFRRIDDGLWPLLEGEKVPLVLASVEEYHTMYKNQSRYKYISTHMLSGNTDNLSPGELRMQLDPVFDYLAEKDQNDISSKLNRDFNRKNTVDNESDLLYNLEIDNIDTLLVPANYPMKDETKILQIEHILRICYKRNIDVSIRDDHKTLAAITRNEVVVKPI